MTSQPAIAPVSCFVTMVSSTNTPSGASRARRCPPLSNWAAKSVSPGFLAYGGSAKMTSKCEPPCSSRRRALKASALTTRPCGSFVRTRLSSITLQALLFCSMNCASTAPRLRHSNPIAPEPAKMSSTRAPCTVPPRMEKTASRTRSVVGRVTMGGTLMPMPPAMPEMMRMEKRSGSRRSAPAHQALKRPASESPRSHVPEAPALHW